MQKVVDTIKIEKLEGGAFNVVQGDRYSDTLSYDELLGLVSALTIAKEPMCLRWMQTKEEHEARRVKVKYIPTEVEFEDILVPESIEIYQIDFKGNYGDRILIKFNDSQLLGYYVNNWIVNTYQSGDSRITKIQCKLIPCNRQDLKAGDTAVFIPKEFKGSFEEHLFDTTNYCKILDYQKYVYVIDDGGIETNFDNDAYSWYKVIPV
uniref:hypothetical protein n=1 Tax=uncultured Dysgonomonas sp. TaxID=206096 RepID=UPI002587618E|nr:hypothetical protein [uncultured Dysgonomonas sp.]